MAYSDVIIGWLKEAGAYASECEAPKYAFARGQVFYTGPVLRVDVIVKAATVGVIARRGEREKFECCTWAQLERAESNPLLALIDEAVEAVG